MAQSDGTREQAITHWSTAAMVAVLILVMWLFLPIEWIWDMNDPDFMPLVLLAPFLGVFGLYHAALGLRWTLRARRFGETSMDIKGGDVGRMGQRLEGTVRTATSLRPTGDYRLVLQCVETHQFRNTGSGAGTHHAHDFVLWEQAVTVPAAGTDSAKGIPFAFQLPASVREEQQMKRDPNAVRMDYAIAIPFMKKIWTNKAPTGTAWQLTISAPIPGTDFKAVFTVPVERP